MGSFVEAKVTSHWYPLVLQTSEETLHWAIIPAVSTATHTLLDPITLQHLPELPACVMPPLVAMEHHSLWFTTRFPGHLQRFYSQSAVR